MPKLCISGNMLFLRSYVIIREFSYESILHFYCRISCCNVNQIDINLYWAIGNKLLGNILIKYMAA